MSFELKEKIGTTNLRDIIEIYPFQLSINNNNSIYIEKIDNPMNYYYINLDINYIHNNFGINTLNNSYEYFKNIFINNLYKINDNQLIINNINIYLHKRNIDINTILLLLYNKINKLENTNEELVKKINIFLGVKSDNDKSIINNRIEMEDKEEIIEEKEEKEQEVIYPQKYSLTYCADEKNQIYSLCNDNFYRYNKENIEFQAGEIILKNNKC